MAAALFGKKEPGDVDPAETPSDDRPSELVQLTAQLGQLGELLEKANEQIAAYLVRRESQFAGGTGEGGSGGLGQQITALLEKLDKLVAGSAPGATGVSPVRGEHGQDARATQPPGGEGLKALLEPLRERLDQVDAGVKALGEKSTVKDATNEGASGATILEAVQRLQSQLDGGLQRIVDLLAPAEEPEEKAAGAATGSAHWEWAVLGPDLAQRPNLASQRQQLLSGVLEGDPGACALTGQLLVFQSAPAERLPQLLKDLGEAFYRWHPKTVDQPDHAPHGVGSVPGTNLMEEALVEWLRRSCEAAGIYNTIALVHPGERFDSTRHTAASRGVEITDVHGWIVLRDNGKVYTKAAVAVQ
ncbi:MAG: hypothetical protein ABIK89_12060 [Planctomycetota bacterium]